VSHATVRGRVFCARARRRSKHVRAALYFVLGLLFATRATEAQPGFALDRFEPAERGSEWLALDSLDFRQQSAMAVGLTADFAHRPLIAYDENGEELAAIVQNQLYAHIGASFVWLRRLRLGINLPLLLVNDGEQVLANGALVGPDSGPGVGDVRLSLDARVFGAHGSPFSFALGTSVHLPTGRRGAFSSDGYTRLSPHVRAAGSWQWLSYAAQTGITLRADRSLLGQPVGTEWTFAGAAGVRLLKRRLLIGPEFWGSTVVSSSSHPAFDREGTPLEAVLGGRYTLTDCSFGLGVGPGLARGLGTPALRLLGLVQWAPQPPPAAPVPRDADHDTVLDENDACPREAGYPSRHGCPLPPAVIPAPVLDCEPAAGLPPNPGCPPPPDADGDGIADSVDACREAAGKKSEDPAKHGCPAPSDADSDGIPDVDDACPSLAGAPNEDGKRHGCPLVEVTADRIRIFERVEFEVGSARLRPESDVVLGAVFKVLSEREDVKRVKVVGHTDSAGTRMQNVRLSKQRAEAVVAWLVARGVSANRLVPEGLGPDQPIADNVSEEGRRANRRVEFEIQQASGKDAPPESKGTR
jgi:OOP family OmpA-OmpF porin